MYQLFDNDVMDDLFYDASDNFSPSFSPSRFDDYKSSKNELDSYSTNLFDEFSEFEYEDLDTAVGDPTPTNTTDTESQIAEYERSKNRGAVRMHAVHPVGRNPLQGTDPPRNRDPNNPRNHPDVSFIGTDRKRVNLEVDRNDTSGHRSSVNHQREHLQAMHNAAENARQGLLQGMTNQQVVDQTRSTFVETDEQGNVTQIRKVGYKLDKGRVIEDPTQSETIDFRNNPQNLQNVLQSGILESRANTRYRPPAASPRNQRSPQGHPQQQRPTGGQRSPQTRSSRSSSSRSPQQAQRSQAARLGQTRTAQRMQTRSQQAHSPQTRPQRMQRPQAARPAQMRPAQRPQPRSPQARPSQSRPLQRMQRSQATRAAQMRSQPGQRPQARSPQARPSQSRPLQRMQRSQATRAAQMRSQPGQRPQARPSQSRPPQRMQRPQASRSAQMRSRSASPRPAQRARRIQRNRFDAFAEFF